MTDGKDYNVELDGVVKSFTATDGTVVSVGLEKTEIVAATATKINAVVKGANDVVLDTITYPGNGTVTVSINVTNGYTTADSLYLNNVGDTATVDVVYHTGKYDANGNETGNVEAKGIVVTAVAAEVITVNNWAVKVGNASATAFDKVTETKLAVGDTGKAAYIQTTNSKNEKSSNIADYVIETSNKDALLVNVVNATTGEITLTPIKEGTSYLLVKDSKGNVVTTLPIVISAARKATTLELNKTSVTLSKTISETSDIEFTLKDQYGEKLAAPGSVDLKTLTYNNGTTTVNTDTTFDAPGAGLTNGKYTVDSTVAAAGTYVVKATISGLSQTFTVVIKTAPAETATNVSYALDMTASTADAVIKADATANTEITATVYKLVGGVKASAITSGAINVTLKNSKGEAQSVSVAPSGEIKITVANISTGAKLATGTYTLSISGKTGTTVPTFTRNIVITDTQSAVTVKRVAESGATVNACFEFYYEGTKITPDSVDYKNPAGGSVSSTGAIAVGSAEVTFKVGTNTVKQTVNIGLTVTVQ